MPATIRAVRPRRGEGSGIFSASRSPARGAGRRPHRERRHRRGRDGGLYRSSDDGGPTAIERTAIDGNTALPEGSPGLGGGVYLRGTVAAIAASTVSRNGATAGAGVTAVAERRTELSFANVTVALNRAIAGNGGGLSLGPGVVAVVRNATVVRNEALGPSGTGGGIAADPAAGVTLAGSIVAENLTGDLAAPINCLGKMKNGGGNLQYPILRQMGGSDDPGALCSDEAVLEDPALADDLADNGGPTETVAVPWDQRGQPRAMATCTAGALELR